MRYDHTIRVKCVDIGSLIESLYQFQISRDEWLVFSEGSCNKPRRSGGLEVIYLYYVTPDNGSKGEGSMSEAEI